MEKSDLPVTRHRPDNLVASFLSSSCSIFLHCMLVEVLQGKLLGKVWI